jgi:hypothetical protein
MMNYHGLLGDTTNHCTTNLTVAHDRKAVIANPPNIFPILLGPIFETRLRKRSKADPIDRWIFDWNVEQQHKTDHQF